MVEIERERKYLVRNADIFKYIIQQFSIPANQIIDEHHAIKAYKVQNQGYLIRPYRYFDTFNRDLERQLVFAFVGPSDLKRKQLQPVGILEKKRTSASVRERKETKDIVVTVKYPEKHPDERHQHELSVTEEDFYHFDPNKYFNQLPAFQSLQAITQNCPLQEAVRLNVERKYFNLVRDGEWKMQIAADKVIGRSSIGLEKIFYELEIEVEEKGTIADKDSVASYFEEKYGDTLIKSSLPKWIKALQLLRGKEILADK